MKTSARTLLPALATAAALTLLASGCSLFSSDGPATLVVGDSVTFLSGGRITAELGDSNTEIIAKPGYRSVDLLPQLKAALERTDGPASKRERAVFLVGYNDVARKTVDAKALPAMIKESNRFDCALWLTIPARPGGKASSNPKFRPEAVDLWNSRMRDEVAKYPNVHLVKDWQTAVQSADTSELIDPDGLHPNEAGRRRLADAIHKALDRDC